jgi:DNA-binding protein Fis
MPGVVQVSALLGQTGSSRHLPLRETMKDQLVASSDISKLYKQVEGKLESIVEKLLTSKLNDSDNVLQSVQAMTEKVFIACAMKVAKQNVSQASKLLGINRNTLAKKLKELQKVPQDT